MDQIQAKLNEIVLAIYGLQQRYGHEWIPWTSVAREVEGLQVMPIS